MDGTEERKDSSQVEDTSGEQKETPKEPQTFTKESEKKAIDDALSAAGRDAKSITEKTTEAQKILESAQKTRTDVLAEQERWQTERNEAEKEAAKEDPDALKSVQERQRQRAKDAELARKTQELSARETKVAEAEKKESESTKERNAREIATRLGVDSKLLVKLAKLTDGSTEAIEAEAKILPTKGEPKTPLKTDAGTTTGGSLSDDALIKKSASGVQLNADEKVKVKQILGNLKGKIV